MIRSQPGQNIIITKWNKWEQVSPAEHYPDRQPSEGIADFIKTINQREPHQTLHQHWYCRFSPHLPVQA